jgi:hypothetical protein
MLSAAARAIHTDRLITAEKLISLAFEYGEYEVCHAIVIASALETKFPLLEQREFHILIQPLYRSRIQRVKPFQVAIRLGRNHHKIFVTMPKKTHRSLLAIRVKDFNRS